MSERDDDNREAITGSRERKTSNMSRTKDCEDICDNISKTFKKLNEGLRESVNSYDSRPWWRRTGKKK